jgi:hypothetical protein
VATGTAASNPGTERGSPEVLSWAVALVVTWAALAALGFGARDPDSRLYAEIAARTAAAPLSQWITPDFPPGWFMHGPFREHPSGFFAPPAMLSRLGYPAPQAAYAVNVLYQILALALVVRLAATVVAGAEARALGWLLQLLPIAFTFRIRANHEAAVLLCLLAALLGTERARSRPRWAVLTALGLVGLLLVKGLLAVFGPVLCALWLLARGLTASRPAPSDRAAWLGLALSVAAMGVAAAVYESIYRQATGEPFWSFYATRQLGVAAVADSGTRLARCAYNLVWYLGRVLWFAFPWSLTLLAAAWHLRANAGSAPDPAPSVADPKTRAGTLFVVSTVALYVGVFSLSDRRADRYLFPAYYAVGAAGAVAALRAWPRLRRLAGYFDRPWAPAAVFVLAFLLHLAGGRLGIPTVKVWAPG